ASSCVISMANRANVYMRLGSIKLFLGHASPSFSVSGCLQPTCSAVVLHQKRIRITRPDPVWRHAAD
ncbi:MAG TPA: hypothetical protein DEO58_06680, partial [Alphaproteobacteria bacterium]|nr:hypothetical protein [Alphaproteobacteria bacterium]